jgi:hypothetical protein
MWFETQQNSKLLIVSILISNNSFKFSLRKKTISPRIINLQNYMLNPSPPKVIWIFE